jgi:hypothetical protein
MKKSKRTALLITACTFFIVLTPLILLYASGYRLDWTTKSLQRFGIIVLVSQPSSIQTFVNNEAIDRRSPVRIRDLAPGNYDIRIEKDGFIPWQKILEVEAEMVTKAEHIVLFIKEPERKQLSEDTVIFTTKHADHKNELLAVIKPEKEDKGYEIKKIFLRNRRSEVLSSANQGNATGEFSLIVDSADNLKHIGDLAHIHHMSMAPSERIIIINTTVNDTEMWAQFNMQTATWHEIKFERAPIGTPLWSKSNNNSIIYQSEEDLREKNLLTNQEEIIAPHPVAGFQPSPQGVLIIEKSDTTENTNQEDDNRTLTLTHINNRDDRTVISEFIPNHSHYTIVASAQQQFALIPDNGHMIIIPKVGEAVTLESAVKHAVWSERTNDQQETLLYHTTNEIHIYEPEKEEGIAFKDTIARQTSPINHVAWYNKFEHIIFQSEHEIIAIERDGRSHRNSAHLVEHPLLSSFYLSTNKKFLYVHEDVDLIEYTIR